MPAIVESGKTNPKGLSGLIAAVIVIAVTVVAGLSLYGYFQGQTPNPQGFASTARSVVNSVVNPSQAGTYYNSAQVTASVVSCTDSTGTCVIQLSDTGTANTQAIGCQFTGTGGGGGTLSPNPAPVTVGSPTQVSCANSGGQGSGTGNQVTGSISFADGASAFWTGTWQ